MAQVSAPAMERKRVKVYELRSNDWYDRGTGFCKGIHVNLDEAKIIVSAEDDPNRQLLETTISREDGYQKQQDTLIVWTERNGVDMALSFQEPEGCAGIWDFVQEVISQIQPRTQEDGLSDDLIEQPSPINLPAPTLKNLPQIEAMIRDANLTQNNRDALAKHVLAAKYIPQLIPLVEIAEDLESLEDLHRLCSIMKILILLNDASIIETVVLDEIVLGAVGALEYDPDFPLYKANHRQYLSDESKFKEVVPIEDELIRKKIHYTYRLQYLKDVVLARILDDPTFSVLNSLIFFHQVDIVQNLQGNHQYLFDLFAIFSPKEQNMQRKKDAVSFIQQCCTVGKSLPQANRAQMYQNFINHGLLEVIQFALKHRDASVRVAGTDTLVALIDHDALMVRTYVFKAIQENTKPLTDTLIELLLVEVDLGVTAQIADSIKVLLDPTAIATSIEALSRSNSDFLAKVLPKFEGNSGDTFIHTFYDVSAKKLFQPLKDLEDRESLDDLSVQEVSLYTHLLEVLCFFLRQHHFRSKYLVINENLSGRVAQLMSCPQKYLKLNALKYFRTCIGLQDEHINKQIVNQRLFEPILQVLFDTMPRDNLLNSVCLEMFEFIRRDAIKEFVKHLATTYREKLQAITYVDTFQGLLNRYDQMMEPPTTQELEDSFTSVDSDTPARNNSMVNGGKWGTGLKELDPDEEAYYNHASDDEDDGVPNAVKSNGASPVRPLPLVGYADDDDEDDMDILATNFPSKSPPKTATTTQAPVTPNTRSSSKATLTSPPERISEKRRREEEEEDELLANVASAGSKRKASLKSNSDTQNLQKLRRKNSMSSAKDSGGGPKKITISILQSSSEGSQSD